MMRILHLGKFYPPVRGGIESYTAALASACVAKETKIAVLAHAPPGIHKTKQTLVEDVQITLVGCYGQILYTPISPTFPWHLARLVRHFRPDILHLHMPNPSVFFALLNSFARKIPWVVHWHSDIPVRTKDFRMRLAYQLYRPWEQAVLQRAKAIIATSVPYRDSSAALTRWREKTHVIPLGLAMHRPKSIFDSGKDQNINQIQILAVGRLTYYKGLDVLLRALVDIPEARLLLVGSGEQKGALQALAHYLGITSRVEFAGGLDDESLLHAYARSEIFCLPSIERTEAFGLVLLEAMRARLPVVASAISGSGVGFVVQDNVTGLLVPPGDPSALSVALRKFVHNRTLRQSFGLAGYLRWQQHFTLEKGVEQTLALYRNILQQNPRYEAIKPIK